MVLKGHHGAGSVGQCRGQVSQLHQASRSRNTPHQNDAGRWVSGISKDYLLHVHHVWFKVALGSLWNTILEPDLTQKFQCLECPFLIITETHGGK